MGGAEGDPGPAARVAGGIRQGPRELGDHLTVVGHSAGADISMYFAKLHPELTKKVVTLDNLRVPFVTEGRFKILSFRSKDPQFRSRRHPS
jgi:pimeloyl-ACP methyl ester carboxylesterase